MPNDRHPCYGGRNPPAGNLLLPPRHGMPGRACKPRGQPQVPTPKRPHQQPVGNEPPLPAQKDGRPGESECLAP